MTARYAPVAAGIALLALTGCVPNGSQSPTPAPSESSTDDHGHGLPSTDPTAPFDDGEVAPIPEAEATSQSDAIATAARVMETFAQPELSAEEWWSAMLPLLSQQGAHAYEGVDPELIPVSAVTGPGTVLEGSTDVALIVQVPTDAGPYNVSLSRADTTAPWLADLIRPAQG